MTLSVTRIAVPVNQVSCVGAENLVEPVCNASASAVPLCLERPPVVHPVFEDRILSSSISKLSEAFGSIAKEIAQGVGIDFLRSMRWLPPRDIFPTDLYGKLRLLSYAEVVGVVANVGKSICEEFRRELTDAEWILRISTLFPPTAEEFYEKANWIFWPSDFIGLFSWFSVHSPYFLQLLQSDYPDHQVIPIARDGLVMTLTPYFREGVGNKALYWPGWGEFRPPLDQEAKDQRAERIISGETPLTDADRMIAVSEYWYRKVVNAIPEGMPQDTRTERIVDAYLSEMKKSPPVMRYAEEGMRPQLAGLNLDTGTPVLLYDTFGSGKTATHIAALLKHLAGIKKVDIVVTFPKTSSTSTSAIPDKFPFRSLAQELGINHKPFDFIWPFEKGDAGLFKLNHHMMISFTVLALAAYNFSLQEGLSYPPLAEKPFSPPFL